MVLGFVRHTRARVGVWKVVESEEVESAEKAGFSCYSLLFTGSR
jgi:hypothetical protein